MINSSRHIVKIEHTISRSIASRSFRNKRCGDRFVIYRHYNYFNANLENLGRTQFNYQLIVIFRSQCKLVSWIQLIGCWMILTTASASTIPFTIYRLFANKCVRYRFELKLAARVRTYCVINSGRLFIL